MIPINCPRPNYCSCCFGLLLPYALDLCSHYIPLKVWWEGGFLSKLLVFTLMQWRGRGAIYCTFHWKIIIPPNPKFGRDIEKPLCVSPWVRGAVRQSIGPNPLRPVTLQPRQISGKVCWQSKVCRTAQHTRHDTTFDIDPVTFAHLGYWPQIAHIYIFDARML